MKGVTIIVDNIFKTTEKIILDNIISLMKIFFVSIPLTHPLSQENNNGK